MHSYLPLAILLLIQVIHKILAQLFYFKALDTGLFPASNIKNLFDNNDFGFLLGFWNILWWVLFAIFSIWWIISWFPKFEFNE